MRFGTITIDGILCGDIDVSISNTPPEPDNDGVAKPHSDGLLQLASLETGINEGNHPADIGASQENMSKPSVKEPMGEKTNVPEPSPQERPVVHGSERLEAAQGRHPDLEHVDPRLREIVAAGGKHLPPGYKVVVTEGYNPNGHVAASQHHIKGRGALDVQIVGPNGPISNKGADKTGLYTHLARSSYGEMLARYPELKGKFTWGGAFGTARGSSTPDLMHFDLGGERGNASRVPSHMGALPGENYGAQRADYLDGATNAMRGNSNHLSSARASFAKELEDPAARERLFRLTSAENPKNPQAFMESVMNRAASRGQTLNQAMNDKHYYPHVSMVGKEPNDRDKLGSAMKSVLGGSNLTNYATGNASGNVGFGYKHGKEDPHTYVDPRTGERYGVENRPSDIKWAQKMRANEESKAATAPKPEHTDPLLHKTAFVTEEPYTKRPPKKYMGKSAQQGRTRQENENTPFRPKTGVAPEQDMRDLHPFNVDPNIDKTPKEDPGDGYMDQPFLSEPDESKKI